MAEAPRPAVAGISQPDAGTLSSKLELVGFFSSVHGEARHYLHSNPRASLNLFRAPPSAAVAGTAVAGAALFPCSLPELLRLGLACMRTLPERGRRGRPNGAGAVACLGRKSRRSSRQLPVSQSQCRPSPALTMHSDPISEFSKNGNFPKWKLCITQKSELPQVITSSYELRFTRSSRLRTRFDETYNFREESFPKFRTYKKSNV